MANFAYMRIIFWHKSLIVGKGGLCPNLTTNNLVLHALQGILYAVYAAEDMISGFLGAEEDAPGGQDGQRAAVGQLLQILQRSASLQAEAPRDAAVPLGSAILEPLCQLITSMLGLLQSQPADAQV